jgi:hypothetical protein
MSLLVNFQSNLEQEWSVRGVHKCARLTKGQLTSDDLGARKLENVSKVGNPPHEAIQRLIIGV